MSEIISFDINFTTNMSEVLQEFRALQDSAGKLGPEFSELSGQIDTMASSLERALGQANDGEDNVFDLLPAEIAPRLTDFQERAMQQIGAIKSSITQMLGKDLGDAVVQETMRGAQTAMGFLAANMSTMISSSGAIRSFYKGLDNESRKEANREIVDIRRAAVDTSHRSAYGSGLGPLSDNELVETMYGNKASKAGFEGVSRHFRTSEDSTKNLAKGIIQLYARPADRSDYYDAMVAASGGVINNPLVIEELKSHKDRLPERFRTLPSSVTEHTDRSSIEANPRYQELLTDEEYEVAKKAAATYPIFQDALRRTGVGRRTVRKKGGSAFEMPETPITRLQLAAAEGAMYRDFMIPSWEGAPSNYIPLDTEADEKKRKLASRNNTNVKEGLDVLHALAEVNEGVEPVFQPHTYASGGKWRKVEKARMSIRPDQYQVLVRTPEDFENGVMLDPDAKDSKVSYEWEDSLGGSGFKMMTQSSLTRLLGLHGHNTFGEGSKDMPSAPPVQMIDFSQDIFETDENGVMKWEDGLPVKNKKTNKKISSMFEKKEGQKWPTVDDHGTSYVPVTIHGSEVIMAREDLYKPKAEESIKRFGLNVFENFVDPEAQFSAYGDLNKNIEARNRMLTPGVPMSHLGGKMPSPENMSFVDMESVTGLDGASYFMPGYLPTDMTVRAAGVLKGSFQNVDYKKMLRDIYHLKEGEPFYIPSMQAPSAMKATYKESGIGAISKEDRDKYFIDAMKTEALIDQSMIKSPFFQKNQKEDASAYQVGGSKENESMYVDMDTARTKFSDLLDFIGGIQAVKTAEEFHTNGQISLSRQVAQNLDLTEEDVAKISTEWDQYIRDLSDPDKQRALLFDDPEHDELSRRVKENPGFIKTSSLAQKRINDAIESARIRQAKGEIYAKGDLAMSLALSNPGEIFLNLGKKNGLNIANQKLADTLTLGDDVVANELWSKVLNVTALRYPNTTNEQFDMKNSQDFISLMGEYGLNRHATYMNVGTIAKMGGGDFDGDTVQLVQEYIREIVQRTQKARQKQLSGVSSSVSSNEKQKIEPRSIRENDFGDLLYRQAVGTLKMGEISNANDALAQIDWDDPASAKVYGKGALDLKKLYDIDSTFLKTGITGEWTQEARKVRNLGKPFSHVFSKLTKAVESGDFSKNEDLSLVNFPSLYHALTASMLVSQVNNPISSKALEELLTAQRDLQGINADKKSQDPIFGNLKHLRADYLEHNLRVMGDLITGRANAVSDIDKEKMVSSLVSWKDELDHVSKLDGLNEEQKKYIETQRKETELQRDRQRHLAIFGVLENNVKNPAGLGYAKRFYKNPIYSGQRSHYVTAADSKADEIRRRYDQMAGEMAVVTGTNPNIVEKIKETQDTENSNKVKKAIRDNIHSFSELDEWSSNKFPDDKGFTGPMKWYRHRVLGTSRKVPSQAVDLGSAVHEAVSYWANNRIKKDAELAESGNFYDLISQQSPEYFGDPDALEEEFVKALRKQGTFAGKIPTEEGGIFTEKIVEKYANAVKFIRSLPSRYRDEQILASEKEVTPDFGDNPIDPASSLKTTGIVDLISRDKDGRVIISDVKSHDEQDAFPQIYAYASAKGSTKIDKLAREATLARVISYGREDDVMKPITPEDVASSKKETSGVIESMYKFYLLGGDTRLFENDTFSGPNHSYIGHRSHAYGETPAEAAARKAEMSKTPVFIAPFGKEVEGFHFDNNSGFYKDKDEKIIDHNYGYDNKAEEGSEEDLRRKKEFDSSVSNYVIDTTKTSDSVVNEEQRKAWERDRALVDENTGRGLGKAVSLQSDIDIFVNELNKMQSDLFTKKAKALDDGTYNPWFTYQRRLNESYNTRIEELAARGATPADLVNAKIARDNSQKQLDETLRTVASADIDSLISEIEENQNNRGKSSPYLSYIKNRDSYKKAVENKTQAAEALATKAKRDEKGAYIFDNEGNLVFEEEADAKAFEKANISLGKLKDLKFDDQIRDDAIEDITDQLNSVKIKTIEDPFAKLNAGAEQAKENVQTLTADLRALMTDAGKSEGEIAEALKPFDGLDRAIEHNASLDAKDAHLKSEEANRRLLLYGTDKSDPLRYDTGAEIEARKQEFARRQTEILRKQGKSEEEIAAHLTHQGLAPDDRAALVSDISQKKELVGRLKKSKPELEEKAKAAEENAQNKKNAHDLAKKELERSQAAKKEFDQADATVQEADAKLNTKGAIPTNAEEAEIRRKREVAVQKRNEIAIDAATKLSPEYQVYVSAKNDVSVAEKNKEKALAQFQTEQKTLDEAAQNAIIEREAAEAAYKEATAPLGEPPKKPNKNRFKNASNYEKKKDAYEKAQAEYDKAKDEQDEKIKTTEKALANAKAKETEAIANQNNHSAQRDSIVTERDTKIEAAKKAEQTAKANVEAHKPALSDADVVDKILNDAKLTEDRARIEASDAKIDSDNAQHQVQDNAELTKKTEQDVLEASAKLGQPITAPESKTDEKILKEDASGVAKNIYKEKIKGLKSKAVIDQIKERATLEKVAADTLRTNIENDKDLTVDAKNALRQELSKNGTYGDTYVDDELAKYYGNTDARFGLSMKRHALTRNRMIHGRSNRRSWLTSNIDAGRANKLSLEEENVSYNEQLDKLKEEQGSLAEGTEAYRKNAERQASIKKLMDQNIKDMTKVGPAATVASAAFGRISSSIARVGAQLGRRLFQKATQEAIQFVKQFDASMTQVQMITQKSNEEMQEVRAGTITKAIELHTSVSDVATTKADLYRQGLSDSEVDSRLDTVLKFSKVTGTKAADATTAITTAIESGLTDSASRMSDILVSLGDTAATTAGEIAKGIQKSGAAAKVAGVTDAELSVLLALGTSSTQLRGNQIGTALQTIFSRMRSVTKQGYVNDETGASTSINDVENALNIAGVKLREDDGSFRSSYKVLEELSTKWGGLTDEQKGLVTTSMAGTRQTNIFQSLMEGMSENDGADLKQMMENANNSEGATDTKYDTYANSIQAALDTVQSSFDGFVEAFTENGVITGALDMVSSFFQKLSSIGDGAGDTAQGITLLCTAIAGGIGAIIAVAKLGSGPVGMIVSLLSLVGGLVSSGILASLFSSGEEADTAEGRKTERYTKVNENADADVSKRKAKISSVQSDIDKINELQKGVDNKTISEDEAFAQLETTVSSLASTMGQSADSIMGNVDALTSFKSAAQNAAQAAKAFQKQESKRIAATKELAAYESVEALQAQYDEKRKEVQDADERDYRNDSGEKTIQSNDNFEALDTEKVAAAAESVLNLFINNPLNEATGITGTLESMLDSNRNNETYDFFRAIYDVATGKSFNEIYPDGNFDSSIENLSPEDKNKIFSYLFRFFPDASKSYAAQYEPDGKLKDVVADAEFFDKYTQSGDYSLGDFTISPSILSELLKSAWQDKITSIFAPYLLDPTTDFDENNAVTGWLYEEAQTNHLEAIDSWKDNNTEFHNVGSALPSFMSTSFKEGTDEKKAQGAIAGYLSSIYASKNKGTDQSDENVAQLNKDSLYDYYDNYVDVGTVEDEHVLAAMRDNFVALMMNNGNVIKDGTLDYQTLLNLISSSADYKNWFQNNPESFFGTSIAANMDKKGSLTYPYYVEENDGTRTGYPSLEKAKDAASNYEDIQTADSINVYQGIKDRATTAWATGNKGTNAGRTLIDYQNYLTEAAKNGKTSSIARKELLTADYDDLNTRLNSALNEDSVLSASEILRNNSENFEADIKGGRALGDEEYMAIAFANTERFMPTDDTFKILTSRFRNEDGTLNDTFISSMLDESNEWSSISSKMAEWLGEDYDKMMYYGALEDDEKATQYEHRVQKQIDQYGYVTNASNGISPLYQQAVMDTMSSNGESIASLSDFSSTDEYIEYLRAAQKAMEDLYETGEVSEERLKSFNENALKAGMSALREYGDDTDEISESVVNFGHDARSAASETKKFITSLAGLSNRKYLIDQFKKGNRSNDVLTEIFGSKENYKALGKDAAEQVAKGYEEGLDEEGSVLTNTIAETLEAELNSMDPVNVDQLIKMSTTADGNFDLESLRTACQQLGLEVDAILAAYEGMGGSLTLQVSKTDDKVEAKIVSSDLGNGKKSGGGGGGGGGKSAAQKLIDAQKHDTDLYNHQIKMVQYEQTKYQNAGELGNYGSMIQEEINLEKARLPVIQSNIDALRNQMATIAAGSDDWYSLRDAITAAEEEMAELNNTIDENIQKIEENQQAILKLHTDLEDTVQQVIEAQIQAEKDQLSGSVTMQETILEAIRQRYQDEWDLVKKDIETKKQALEEEKSLIDERLQKRKDAEDEEEKYRELAELRSQLAMISMDSTRTKDAAELREKIGKLEKEIGWDIAEDEAKSEQNAIQDQIDAYDEYQAYEDEDLEAYLADANNFADEVNTVLGMSQEDLFDWLKTNVKEYMNSLADAREQMVQDWEDTFKQMYGIVDTYYDMINDILSGKQSFLDYMMTGSDYINASEDMKAQMLYEWGEAYDNWTNAAKVDAVYSHTDADLSSGTTNITKQAPSITSEVIAPDKMVITWQPVRYANGGLVDFTGPAWVDGTKSRPEAFLSADDTQMLRSFLDMAKYTSVTPVMSSFDTSSVKAARGVTIDQVSIVLNEAKLEDDADYQAVAQHVGEVFVKELSKQGFQTVAYAF